MKYLKMNKENTQHQPSLTSTHYSHFNDDDDSFTNQDSYMPHHKAHQLLSNLSGSAEPRETTLLTKQ